MWKRSHRHAIMRRDAINPEALAFLASEGLVFPDTLVVHLARPGIIWGTQDVQIITPPVGAEHWGTLVLVTVPESALVIEEV